MGKGVCGWRSFQAGSRRWTGAGSAIERLHGLRAEDLRRLYDQGDPKAIDAFRGLVARCGRLLANLATLIDPDLIVVGGGLSQLGPWFLDPLQQEVRTQAYSLAREVPLVSARWGEEAGVRGLLELRR